MNFSGSQARFPSIYGTGFAPLDFSDSAPLDYFAGGGEPAIQTFGAVEQSASQAAASQDVDAATNAQDVDENELLAANNLPKVDVVGQQAPWLRRASLYRAINYKGPSWLTGQENWVYLVVLALAAGSAWWYFNRK
jgi:hypothetical protein